MRYLSGHSHRKGQTVSPNDYRRQWRNDQPNVPFGYCQCGCGERMQTALHTMTDRGWVKGEPKRYLHGHRGRVVTEAHEPEICRRYEAGEHPSALAAAFGCGQWSIRNVLVKRGIRRRSQQEAQTKYSCDHSYFDAIDTEQKAYWLGFVGADGCVIVNGNTRIFQVKLAAQDFEHVIRLRNALRSDHPIYPLVPTPQDPRALQVSSPRLVEGLENHGIHPRKTAIYEWPNFLPDDLLPHYLRGYFDGDGCFSFSRNQPCFGLAGQEDFLRGCQGFLMRSVGVGETKLADHGGVFNLAYSGRRQVPRIARFMYDNATVWMPRKRERVAHLL